MWKMCVFLLCVTACTEQGIDTPSLELNTARVSIIKSDGDLEVGVEHDLNLLERRHVGTLVMDLGQVVGEQALRRCGLDTGSQELSGKLSELIRLLRSGEI